MTRRTCTLHAHTWQSTPRAKQESILTPGELLPVVCTTCSTRFPCAHACGHLDCQVETGRYVEPVVDPSEPAAGYPTLATLDPELAAALERAGARRVS